MCVDLHKCGGVIAALGISRDDSEVTTNGLEFEPSGEAEAVTIVCVLGCGCSSDELTISFVDSGVILSLGLIWSPCL